ncbi:MAG: hypothetical protein NTV81_03405, partial [Candidatus Komeilibacteria bacterium]|nr:hypothetical protein [Candidatus Komeilibacteria bacterium]
MPIPHLSPIKQSSFNQPKRRSKIKLPKSKKEFLTLSWLWFKRQGWKNFIFLIVAGIFAFSALVIWYSRDLPDPNKLKDRAVAQSTKIFDRT